MNQPTFPYCLLAALAIPLAWVGFILLAMVMNAAAPDYSGGNIGGYDIGPALFRFLFWGSLSAITGFVLSLVALLRNEKSGYWAWSSLGLYTLPALAGLLFFIVTGVDHFRHPTP